MSKISLCMIVKNVEKYIDKCLASVVPHVDEVVITDTGSEDGTKKAIQECCPPGKLRLLDFNPQTHPDSFAMDVPESWDNKLPGPFSGKHMLADFAAARNFGWDQATGDYLFWMDSDDVLEGGENLQNIAEQMGSMMDAAFFVYDYAHDGKGQVSSKLSRERLLRRASGLRWTQPVHEFINPGRARPFDGVKVVHKRQDYGIVNPVQNRNLKILLRHAKKLQEENKEIDPRTWYYLATEEKFIWPHSAIKHFNSYLAVSNWNEERAAARVTLGKMYEGSGREDEAFAEYSMAAMEWPYNPESYFGAARLSYLKQNWPRCCELTEFGIKVRDAKEKMQMIDHNPLARTLQPLIYYSVALLEMGKFGETIKVCDEGLKLDPAEPHLIGNKQTAEGKMKEMQESKTGHRIQFKLEEPLSAPPIEVPMDVLSAFAVQIWKRLRAAGQHDKAKVFLQSLPAEIDSPLLREARGLSSQNGVANSVTRIWGDDAAKKLSQPGGPLDIVLWTGPGWEAWSPESINSTGIGGSETAAVRISQELARLGHRVRVFSDCGMREGTYDGAEFIRYEKFLREPVTCDVFVASRNAKILQYSKLHSKANILWAHDVHCGIPHADLVEAIIRADKIFCLSQWHKGFMQQTYPFLDPSIFAVTRNSVDMSRFAAEPKKVGNRIIYASSPDRGLQRLIELLPRIRERVRDVELHIYYGFETWESIARTRNDQEELDRIQGFKNIISEGMKHGAVYHGRVGQKELAEAFLAAKVWAYPTWFTETSCITAMEAQAAGCVPVTTRLAALDETVQSGVRLEPPETTESYAEAFVDHVVKYLNNEDARCFSANLGRAYAQANYGWDKVAVEWERMFFDVLEAKKTYPLIPYGEEALA